MPYIIEAPHMGTPEIWFGRDDRELIARAACAAEKRDWQKEIETIDDALEYIDSDAAWTRYFETDGEALAFLFEQGFGHQQAEARAAMRACLLQRLADS